MEREKRIIHAPQTYTIPQVCYPRVRKHKHKKKPPQRAKFQVIPVPLKYTCIANVFPLYAVTKISLSFFSFYLVAKDD